MAALVLSSCCADQSWVKQLSFPCGTPDIPPTPSSWSLQANIRISKSCCMGSKQANARRCIHLAPARPLDCFHVPHPWQHCKCCTPVPPAHNASNVPPRVHSLSHTDLTCSLPPPPPCRPHLWVTVPYPAQWSGSGGDDSQLPERIGSYHSLAPLEEFRLTEDGRPPSVLGVRSSVVKAISSSDGAAYVLRVINGKQVGDGAARTLLLARKSLHMRHPAIACLCASLEGKGNGVDSHVCRAAWGRVASR
jgi:hypothetical protein